MTRLKGVRHQSATSQWIRKVSRSAVAVTTAEVTDREGALAAFERCAGNLKQVTSVLVDGGYSGKPFAEAVENKPGATVQVARRNEIHMFAVMPQRWVVERSFAWLEKCRRLWKKVNAEAVIAGLKALAGDIVDYAFSAAGKPSNPTFLACRGYWRGWLEPKC